MVATRSGGQLCLPPLERELYATTQPKTHASESDSDAMDTSVRDAHSPPCIREVPTEQQLDTSRYNAVPLLEGPSGSVAALVTSSALQTNLAPLNTLPTIDISAIASLPESLPLDISFQQPVSLYGQTSQIQLQHLIGEADARFQGIISFMNEQLGKGNERFQELTQHTSHVCSQLYEQAINTHGELQKTIHTVNSGFGQIVGKVGAIFSAAKENRDEIITTQQHTNRLLMEVGRLVSHNQQQDRSNQTLEGHLNTWINTLTSKIEVLELQSTEVQQDHSRQLADLSS